MKNFNININNNEFLGKLSFIIVASGLATAAIGIVDYKTTVKCEIEDEHAHLYTDDEGFTCYINDEHIRVNGFTRQDEYITLDEDEVDFYTFLKKKKLINIEDNLDLILAIQDCNQDYLEYEYTYKKRVTRSSGKTSYRTWRTRTGWTSNPENVENEISGRWKDLSFTNNTRLAHYVYQTYKVELNEKGNYVLVEGPVVDDIRDCLSEYPYIRRDFYSIVYLDPNTVNLEESNLERKLVNP